MSAAQRRRRRIIIIQERRTTATSLSSKMCPSLRVASLSKLLIVAFVATLGIHYGQSEPLTAGYSSAITRNESPYTGFSRARDLMRLPHAINYEHNDFKMGGIQNSARSMASPSAAVANTVTDGLEMKAHKRTLHTRSASKSRSFRKTKKLRASLKSRMTRMKRDAASDSGLPSFDSEEPEESVNNESARALSQSTLESRSSIVEDAQKKHPNIPMFTGDNPDGIVFKPRAQQRAENPFMQALFGGGDSSAKTSTSKSEPSNIVSQTELIGRQRFDSEPQLRKTGGAVNIDGTPSSLTFRAEDGGGSGLDFGARQGDNNGVELELNAPTQQDQRANQFGATFGETKVEHSASQIGSSPSVGLGAELPAQSAASIESSQSQRDQGSTVSVEIPDQRSQDVFSGGQTSDSQQQRAQDSSEGLLSPATSTITNNDALKAVEPIVGTTLTSAAEIADGPNESLGEVTGVVEPVLGAVGGTISRASEQRPELSDSTQTSGSDQRQRDQSSAASAEISDDRARCGSCNGGQHEARNSRPSLDQGLQQAINQPLGQQIRVGEPNQENIVQNVGNSRSSSDSEIDVAATQKGEDTARSQDRFNNAMIETPLMASALENIGRSEQGQRQGQASIELPQQAASDSTSQRQDVSIASPVESSSSPQDSQSESKLANAREQGTEATSSQSSTSEASASPLTSDATQRSQQDNNEAGVEQQREEQPQLGLLNNEQLREVTGDTSQAKQQQRAQDRFTHNREASVPPESALSQASVGTNEEQAREAEPSSSSQRSDQAGESQAQRQQGAGVSGNSAQQQERAQDSSESSSPSKSSSGQVVMEVEPTSQRETDPIATLEGGASIVRSQESGNIETSGTQSSGEAREAQPGQIDESEQQRQASNSNDGDKRESQQRQEQQQQQPLQGQQASARREERPQQEQQASISASSRSEGEPEQRQAPNSADVVQATATEQRQQQPQDEALSSASTRSEESPLQLERREQQGQQGRQASSRGEEIPERQQQQDSARSGGNAEQQRQQTSSRGEETPEEGQLQNLARSEEKPDSKEKLLDLAKDALIDKPKELLKHKVEKVFDVKDKIKHTLEKHEHGDHKHEHPNHENHKHKEHKHGEHKHGEHKHKEHKHKEHKHEEHKHEEHKHKEHKHKEHKHEEKPDDHILKEVIELKQKIVGLKHNDLMPHHHQQQHSKHHQQDYLEAPRHSHHHGRPQSSHYVKYPLHATTSFDYQSLSPKCHTKLAELKILIDELIISVGRLSQNIQANPKLPHFKRASTGRRLHNIRSLLEGARVAVNRHQLKLLGDISREIYYELADLSTQEVAYKVDHNLKSQAIKLRRAYIHIKRACRPFV